jgi:hypothetical protein
MHFNKKLLVFPTSRSIREYLKNLKNSNTLLPTCLTINEFLNKSLYLEDKIFIDEEQRFLYLKEAANIEELSRLGFSNEFRFFMNQSEFLFRFFGEIASEHVDIETISQYDTYEFYKEHTTILITIFNNYKRILNKNNAIDKINLDGHYDINTTFLDKFDEVGIFYEGYFTKQEFAIIEKVSLYKSLFINLYSTHYNQKSLENLRNGGFDFKLNHEYILNLTQKCILQENSIEQKQQNINMVPFSVRTHQIAFIKYSIVQMIQKGIEASNIAVILPDESFMSALQLYDKEKYFNYAMGLNIFNENIYKVLIAVYDYLNDKEQKSAAELALFNVDASYIEKNFYSQWNKAVTLELFEQFVAYIKSVEIKDELLEKFDEIIFKLTRLFFQVQQELTFKEAIKILIQKVSALSFDDINSGSITVMGLLESRAVQFDGVIIVDFNENHVPKRSIKDKFLSSQIKKSTGLPTSVDRENLQKYYYSRLIGGAKEVCISYVKNETSQISRFANELFSSNVINHNIKDDEYKTILYNNHRLNHFNHDVILKMDLSQQTWSATSLKTYLTCKRKYYLQYVSKIKEHTVALKPQGFELGDMIHKTLQKLYESYSLHDIDYEKLLKELNTQRIQNPYLILDIEIWKKRLETFIKMEKERFKTNMELLECEKPFLIEHQGIKLKGVIDRIDKINDEYWVLDYKTSSNLKIDTLKNYEKSTDFQLEFYFLACKALFESSNIKTFYYDLYECSLKEEMALELKLETLNGILRDLQTTEVNFTQCEEKSHCLYCPYTIVCNR